MVDWKFSNTCRIAPRRTSCKQRPVCVISDGVLKYDIVCGGGCGRACSVLIHARAVSGGPRVRSVPREGQLFAQSAKQRAGNLISTECHTSANTRQRFCLADHIFTRTLFGAKKYMKRSRNGVINCKVSKSGSTKSRE